MDEITAKDLANADEPEELTERPKHDARSTALKELKAKLEGVIKQLDNPELTRKFKALQKRVSN